MKLWLKAVILLAALALLSLLTLWAFPYYQAALTWLCEVCTA